MFECGLVLFVWTEGCLATVSNLIGTWRSVVCIRLKEMPVEQHLWRLTLAFIFPETSKSLLVTWRTTSLTFNNCTLCPHSVFMCFVFIWEQTATCATYSTNWLVFISEMKSVYSAVRTGALNKAVCASYLNPTGHVMHQQFNIQQLYAVPTLYLCVLYLSENKQRLVPLTA